MRTEVVLCLIIFICKINKVVKKVLTHFPERITQKNKKPGRESEEGPAMLAPLRGAVTSSGKEE